MKKIVYAVLIVLAAAGNAIAEDFITVAAPEIDTAAVMGGVGLLVVGLFMVRARSKPKR